MEKNTKGAWIVHHASKIEEHGATASGLDALRKAGNCGMLLSALSSTQQVQVPMDKARTLAEAAGLDLTYQVPYLLQTLKEQAIIDYNDTTIVVLGLTTRGVLERTAGIYESLSPRPAEEAAIAIAETCSEAPRTEAELSTYIGDNFKLSSQEMARLVKTVEKTKLCDCEPLDPSSKVFFNGSLFRADNLQKTRAVLTSLTVADQGKIAELDQRMAAEGCVDKTKAVASLGEGLFMKLQSIGMYDVSTVSNDKETIQYITKPAAFNKFGRSDVSDAFDLAKAFVASLQYGMTRSTRGRGQIRILNALMRKLIAGETLNPCTAIGQDYRVLEMKGVVQVIPAEMGMFRMKLLKRDVGELALEVLESGDASGQSLTVLPGSPVNRFNGPEVNRVKARIDAQKRNLDVRKALDTLRTTSF
jgi:hypothetical protein